VQGKLSWRKYSMSRVLQQAEDDPSLRSLMVARDGLCDEQWKSLMEVSR
jgi:hypothetical protein